MSTESGHVREGNEKDKPVPGLDSSLLVCGSVRCDGFSPQGPIPAGLCCTRLCPWACRALS